MTVVAPPLSIDPLIAEAKERARRRRLLALGAIVVVAAAVVGTTYGLRSTAGNSLGLCATPPPGWKQETLNRTQNPRFPKVVLWLTNFRFGRLNDFFGGTDKSDWPANGVTISVINYGRRNPRGLREEPLRFTRADFGGLDGSTQPSGAMTVRSQRIVLSAYVEVGTLTPGTIAAVNEALAGVRVCSA